MKRISYYGGALLVILLTYSSCDNINQMETVVEENVIVIKDELQASLEYENFVKATIDLQELDAPVFSLVKIALQNELTTKDEFEIFFIELINPENKEKSLKYLEKIDHPAAQEYYSERIIQFNTVIPQAVNELGNKFPSLKTLPLEEIESLFLNITINSARVSTELDACFARARANFLYNLFTEGDTYASIVYQQTLAWCNTVY